MSIIVWVMASPRRQTTVSFDDDLWKFLNDLAAETKMTVPEIIKDVVEIYLEKWIVAHHAGMKAKQDQLRRQGINVEHSYIIESVIGYRSQIASDTKREAKQKSKRRR